MAPYPCPSHSPQQRTPPAPSRPTRMSGLRWVAVASPFTQLERPRRNHRAPPPKFGTDNLLPAPKLVILLASTQAQKRHWPHSHETLSSPLPPRLEHTHTRTHTYPPCRPLFCGTFLIPRPRLSAVLPAVSLPTCLYPPSPILPSSRLFLPPATAQPNPTGPTPPALCHSL